MTGVEIGAAIFALALLLMLLGVPVAFALLGANLAGAWFLMNGLPGLLQVVDNATKIGRAHV